MLRILLLVAVSGFSFAALAAEPHSHPSPYAGQESRTIKSLSDDDITELRRGGGWGLAKAAELNGVPGPAHLLELKDAIPLSHGQVAAITRLFNDMRAQAIENGNRLIELERELEAHFRNGTVSDGILRQSLNAIADTRMKLRYAHLATHLETPKILSPAQMKAYARLRGYTDRPCAEAPAGHDAEMWRKHNGCQ